MLFSSSDPDESSSLEEREASEAVVTSSEAEDRSDVENGVLDSARVPDLSPILEDEGKQGTPSSSISGSSTLSPLAAILYCQAAMDSGGQDLVSSLSPPRLDADVSGDFGSTVADMTCSSVEGFSLPDGEQKVGVGEQEVAEELGGGDRVAGEALSVPLSLSGSPRVLSIGEHVQTAGLAAGRGVDAGMRLGLVSQPALIGVETVGIAEPGCAISLVAECVQVFPSTSHLPCVAAIVGGGLVREEVQSSPLARGAVRPQPTDGLRQPPLSPVDLREGLTSVGGDSSGSVPIVIRSYAQ
ncbi:hypothetical protein Dimus_001133, partial [Dionaea muscipula]